MYRLACILAHLVKQRQRGTYAYRALHRVLLPIVGETVRKLLNRRGIATRTFARTAGLFGPTRHEDLKPTGLDGLILMIGALLKLQNLFRAFDIFCK